MPALLERESFRSLLLGPPGARQGNNSTSTLVHSRGDSPLEELEATLAQRLRSLYVTSRVWGQRDSCWGEKTEISRRMWHFHLITDTGSDLKKLSKRFQYRCFLSLVTRNFHSALTLGHRSVSYLAAVRLRSVDNSVFHILCQALHLDIYCSVQHVYEEENWTMWCLVSRAQEA